MNGSLIRVPDCFYSDGYTPGVDREFKALDPDEEVVYARKLQEFFCPRVRNCLAHASRSQEIPFDPNYKFPPSIQRMFFVN